MVGICGGYQMLGHRISDPHGVESPHQTVAGLGLLDIETTMSTEKQTHQSRGNFQPAAVVAGFVSGVTVSGYEIHMGETVLGCQANPLLKLTLRSEVDVALEDGAVSEDGRVWGTYLHDIFSVAEVRQQLLDLLRLKRGLPIMPVLANDILNEELDRLAEHLEKHLDMETLLVTLQLSRAEES